MPLSSWEASCASSAGLALRGRTATERVFPPLVVVQCSIPPNSRTVHGFEDEQFEELVARGALGLLFVTEAALAGE